MVNFGLCRLVFVGWVCCFVGEQAGLLWCFVLCVWWLRALNFAYNAMFVMVVWRLCWCFCFDVSGVVFSAFCLLDGFG